MTELSCAVCGTASVPGARFCYHCGAPLDHAPDLTHVGAERRVVTVVFGDLSDFTAWAEDLDPERVGLVTDRVLAALSRAVSDMGGHVDKLTGDGLMAVFGAPTSHEDDAERAVRAAAQMQADVRRLMEEEWGGGRRLGLRVGVNTGEVLAGVQAHLSYTVVGDTVNTASRLADAADVGSVYAGQETALATMPIASWRSLPPLRLKGKRRPVHAYELVGLRPAAAAGIGAGEEVPFIGRDAELGRMVGRLLDVMDRSVPSALVVVGEAGVGKTRLATELARFAGGLPDARVLWGRCAPYGEGRDLAAVAEWVRVACGVGEATPADEVEARVRRTVQRLQQTPGPVVPGGLVDWLLALLGLARGPAPRDAVAPGAGAEPVETTADAVAALLTALAAEGPLVLVADDLQWATASLFAVVAQVAARLTGPVLVVCLGRSDVLDPGDPAAARWWGTLPGPEVLPVAPLDEASTERLLRAYLGGAEIDASAQRTLLARSQGNPFFLAELLALLVDRGLLRRAGDGWRLAGELPSDVLPAGVQAVLAARIDGLDAPTRALLRDASVVGTRFTLGALLAIEPDEQRVRAGLRTLAERGIVAPVDGGADSSYLFAHELARDVAYAGVPKADRARRHAQVAAWAAESMPGPQVDVDVSVAAHAQLAVELAEEMRLPPQDVAWSARPLGATALFRQGYRALARDEDQAAEQEFTRALGVAGDAVPDGQRLRTLAARAMARLGLHRLDEAAADLAAPLTSTDPAARAGALAVHGELLRRRGDADAAARAFVRALTAAAEAGSDRVTGYVVRQLGLLDFRAGRLHSAEARFRQAFELADNGGDRQGQAWALQQLAWAQTTRGDYAQAEKVLARAGEMFARRDDTGGQSWCAGTEAFVRLLQGRLRQARELAQGLLPIGRARGERWGVAACLTIDAFAAAELGEVSTGREEALEACDVFAELGDAWGEAMALATLGTAARGAGDLDGAADALSRAVRLSRRAHHPMTLTLALALLGYTHLDRGDPDAAAEVAAEALQTMERLDLEPRARVGTWVLQAQVLRAHGQRAQALRLLGEAVATGEEPSLLFPRRQAVAHEAGALLEDGQVAAALLTAQRATQVPAEDVRSRVVTLRVLAGCYAAAGDAPAALVAARQALALAGSTEQVGERAATARLLASLSP